MMEVNSSLIISKNFFQSIWIIHQFSCLHAPAKNVRDERKHRYLLNIARALYFRGNIPFIYWGEYILTTTYIINSIPSKILGYESSYEVLHNKLPQYKSLKSFNCLCYATTDFKEHKK